MRSTTSLQIARPRHHPRLHNREDTALATTGWWAEARRDARQSTRMLSFALLLSLVGWGSIILALSARLFR